MKNGNFLIRMHELYFLNTLVEFVYGSNAKILNKITLLKTKKKLICYTIPLKLLMSRLNISFLWISSHEKYTDLEK